MIQSIQSYNEQQAGFRIACDKMNKYLGASLTMVKSFCIVGGPSVGKTALITQVNMNGTVCLKINAVMDTVNIRCIHPFKTPNSNHGGECSMRRARDRQA
jgi:hypothetical protein